MARGSWRLLMAAAVLFMTALGAACSGDDPEAVDGEHGKLSVSMSAQAQKTLWPVGWADAIGTFEVALLVEDEEEWNLEAEWGPAELEDGAEIVFDELDFGVYRVVVIGHCRNDSEYCVGPATATPGDPEQGIPAGSMIAFGWSGEADPDGIVLSEEQMTQDVHIVVSPIIDSADALGSMVVALEWPAGEGVTLVEASLRAAEDDGWPDEPDIFLPGVHYDPDDTPNTLVFSPDDLEPNAYVLRFMLFIGEGEDLELVATAMEVVNIYGNYSTHGLIQLTENDFIEIEDPVEPEPEGYDLTIRFENWADGWGQSLYFPHTGDWDLDTAPSLSIAPEETSGELLIEHASDEDGVLDLQVLSTREWEACWWFNEWTRDGVTLPSGNCQLRIDCQGTEDLLGIDLTFDVGSSTVTGTCLTPERSVSINIEAQDPAPSLEDTLRIEADTNGDDLVLRCMPASICHGSEDMEWYINANKLEGETSAVLSIPKASLASGYRVALLLSYPPLFQSAQVTVGPDWLLE